ncbi:hypothetical protein NC651_029696 [Populus alba x Populus x berolinensis]|nr:hypothetical protein NC651_029696 [Populus alba x Populus x berolinensis]
MDCRTLDINEASKKQRSAYKGNNPPWYYPTRISYLEGSMFTTKSFDCCVSNLTPSGQHHGECLGLSAPKSPPCNPAYYRPPPSAVSTAIHGLSLTVVSCLEIKESPTMETTARVLENNFDSSSLQGLPSISLASLMSRVLQSIAVTFEGKEGGLESFLELFDGRNLVLRAQKN